MVINENDMVWLLQALGRVYENHPYQEMLQELQKAKDLVPQMYPLLQAVHEVLETQHSVLNALGMLTQVIPSKVSLVDAEVSTTPSTLMEMP